MFFSYNFSHYTFSLLSLALRCSSPLHYQSLLLQNFFSLFISASLRTSEAPLFFSLSMKGVNSGMPWAYPSTTPMWNTAPWSPNARVPQNFPAYFSSYTKMGIDESQHAQYVDSFSPAWDAGVGAGAYRSAAPPSLRMSMWQPNPHASFSPRCDTQNMPVTNGKNASGNEEDRASFNVKKKEEKRAIKERNGCTNSQQPYAMSCASPSDPLLGSPDAGVGRLSSGDALRPPSSAQYPTAESSPSSSFIDRICMEFAIVHPLHIDPSASSTVQRWLKRHPYPASLQKDAEKLLPHSGKENSNASPTSDGMVCFAVKGTKWKRAVLPLWISEKGIKTQAMGQSTKKKQSQMLCYMHAARLIEYYNTLPSCSSPPLPLLATELQPGAGPPGKSAARNGGCPVGNSVKPSTSTPQSSAGPTSFPITLPASTSASVGGNDSTYPRLGQQAQPGCVYLTSSEQKRLEYFSRMDIPPSSNPIVNEASERIRQEGTGVNPHALHALNECIPGASADLQAVKILSNVHVVQYPIDKDSELIAVGVARKAKTAKVRCAAHAMHILDIYKNGNHPGKKELIIKRSVSESSGDAGEKENVPSQIMSGIPSPVSGPLDMVLTPSLVHSLPSHNRVLLQFMYHCFGITIARSFYQTPHDTSPSSKNSPSSPASRASIICTVRMADVTCEGEGSNCFEAERRAISTAVSELQFCDDRVAALQTFISCHSHLTPERLPRAQLSTSVQKRIADLVVEEQKTFCMTEGTSPFCSEEAKCLEVPQKTTTEEELFIRALSRPTTEGRNTAWANRMQQSLSVLRTNPIYLRDFFPRRSTLPIASVKELVLSTVREHRVTVIAGTTGCGKTTQVPQYLLDEAIEMGMGDTCNILVTQSRRLSTFNVANRISSERLQVVGKDVGYAVRLESVAGRHINICTTGVLLQMLIKHPLLDHITHLILDEVHDRDINCDVILALAKTILKENKKIRIILMSATIEASLFSSYFDGAPVIQIDGATFPVSVYHLEDVQTILQEKSFSSSARTKNDGSGQLYEGNIDSQKTFQSCIKERNVGELVEEDNFLRTLAAKRADIPLGRIGENSNKSKGREINAFSTKERVPPPSPPKKIDYDLIAELVYHSERAHLRPLSRDRSTSSGLHNGSSNVSSGVDEDPSRPKELRANASSFFPEGKNKNLYASILVFLPGWKEIMAAKQAIERYRYRYDDASGYASPNRGEGSPLCHIIVLHSSVGNEQQRACFLPSPPGHFKVVLATNIAESGITIDDVAVVIDTGLIKETDWRDHNSDASVLRKQWKQEKQIAHSFLDDDIMEGGKKEQGKHSKNEKSRLTSADTAAATSVMTTQLTLKYASRANCTQRTGRAGRTRGGVCYRLFSKRVESMMRDFPEAEIFRVPLPQVILKCLSLGHSLSFLQELIEPPHQKHVIVSMHQLVSLGAVNKEEKLTPLGLYLSRLPCDPRMGKLIIMGAVLRCLDSALTIAASTDATPFLTNRELAQEVKKQRYVLSRQTQSDSVTSLNAYNALCANDGNERFARHNYLDLRQLKIISQYKQQYKDILYHSGLIVSHWETNRRSLSDSEVETDNDEAESASFMSQNSTSTATPREIEEVPSRFGDNPVVTPTTSSTILEKSVTKPGGSWSSQSITPVKDEWGASVIEGRSEAQGAHNIQEMFRDGVLVAGKYFVDTSPYAIYSQDIALVKACVASCLFPNIAVVNVDSWTKKKDKRKGKIVLRTRTIPSVRPAPSSVCRSAGGVQVVPSKKSNPAEYLSFIASNSLSSVDPSCSTLPAFFYVFQDIFRVAHSPSVQVQFLREVSSVSLWALLLFCGSTESFMTYHEVLGIGVVDNWIGVYLDVPTYKALHILRQVLDRCLLRKFKNPMDQQNNKFLNYVQGICREILHSAPERKEMQSTPPSVVENSFDSVSVPIPPQRTESHAVEGGNSADPYLSSSSIDSSLGLLVDPGSIVPPIRRSGRN